MADVLWGGTGTDWFFVLAAGSNKDTVKDLASGEVVTSL
jgi:hypothetical protein